PHTASRQNRPFALLSTPSTVKRRLRELPVRGQPMIERFRDIARALVAVLLLGMAGAAAQTAQSPTSPNPGAASHAGSVPTAQAPAQPAGPAGPKINVAEITARANRDVGVNIEAQALPERVDWMFYSTAQSIIIIFAVNALVTTVFAPRSPQWRLMPASDRAAARICGLVLTLAIVYGVTT